MRRVVLLLGSALTALLLSGTVAFAPTKTYDVADQPGPITNGDFSGNGYPDVAVSNIGVPPTAVSVLINTTGSGAQPPLGQDEGKRACKKGGHTENGFKKQGRCIKDAPNVTRGNSSLPGFDRNNDTP